MADATVRGRFVWHDLHTPNAAGSHDFYGKVLGWNKQAWDQDPSYLMFAAPSGPLGGAVETRSATPQWLSYIGTTDVDEAIAAATALGGRVQTPATALPNGGRYAVLVDPQGATFGVHASSSAAPAEQQPKIGEFSWHELATNVAPSVAFGFYSSLFGWDEVTQYDMGPMGMYLVFGRNGTQLGGMFDKGTQGKAGSAYWLGYVSVDDLDATVERAKTARGSVLTGPMDVPGGDRIAQLMDPHGAFFALHMRAGTARPSSGASARAKPSKPAKAAAPKKKAPAPKKPSSKTQPAKKAAAKKKRPTARKAAKKKPPAKKPTSRKTAKKAKGKAKTRKRGR